MSITSSLDTHTRPLNLYLHQKPLNPATLLPTSDEIPHHDCIEVLQMSPTLLPHIHSILPSTASNTWFISGSSTNTDTQKRAGYAIVNGSKVIEASPRPPGTSSQKAELNCPHMVKNKTINICTDSKYAFSILHSHAAIWKESSLISTQGTAFTNASLILKWLEAAQPPKQIAVIHCRRHQTSSDPSSQGNAFIDTQAKLVTQQPWPSHLLPLVPYILPPPQYSLSQLQLIHKPTYNQNTEGGFSKLLLPDHQSINIITNLHNCFHVGTQALDKHVTPVFIHPSLKCIIHQVSHNCHLCTKTSPQRHQPPLPSQPTNF